jgi:hypothetical protein
LRHYFRLIIFPVIVSAAACSSSPRTPSSAGLRTVLQEYFDDQPAARETLEFYDEAMMCRVVNGNNSCPEQSKPKLEMLIKAGLLSAAAPAPGVTTYRITAEGKRYIHPLGIVGDTVSGRVERKTIGYAIDEARTVVTKIDNFTIPGPNSQGALSTTVWFTIENQPRQWVKPFLPQAAANTHIGESTNGQAELVLTNKGWRVMNLRLNWPLAN